MLRPPCRDRRPRARAANHWGKRSARAPAAPCRGAACGRRLPLARHSSPCACPPPPFWSRSTSCGKASERFVIRPAFNHAVANAQGGSTRRLWPSSHPARPNARITGSFHEAACRAWRLNHRARPRESSFPGDGDSPLFLNGNGRPWRAACRASGASADRPRCPARTSIRNVSAPSRSDQEIEHDLALRRPKARRASTGRCLCRQGRW